MSFRSISPYEKYGKATPLTDANLRVHTFLATDTISQLAEKYLDDWTLWRQIAVRNQLADVRQIPPGTMLIIPQRELKRGSDESG